MFIMRFNEFLFILHYSFKEHWKSKFSNDKNTYNKRRERKKMKTKDSSTICLLFLAIILTIASGIVYLKDRQNQMHVPYSQLPVQLQLQEMNRRLSLLGCIHNENIYIMKHNIDKEKVIFMNEDWTIDRMPQHLTLDVETRKFIEDSLKQ